MKRKMVLAAVLAMILMVVGITALAATDSITQDGVTAMVDCTCYSADGSTHSSSVKISKVEVNKASVNDVTVKVYFKSTCDQDGDHGVDRDTKPIPLDLKRTSCTDEMSDVFYMNVSAIGSEAYESVYVRASANGTSHVWENGKCKNCSAECDHAANQTPPSCEQGAKCSVCGKMVDALGHDVKTIERLEPTCTQPGHTEGSFCERCNKVFIESVSLDALKHDVRTIERLEPTCTQSGHTEGSYCERCKEVLAESTSLNALGHDVKIIERLEPTCIQPGHTEGSYCGRCKEVYAESTSLNALGHDVRTIERLEPTCTQPGHTEGSYCERCSEVFTESISLNPLGHDIKTIEHLEPTCTQFGHTEGSFCERCKEVFTESTSLNALGHDTKMIERLEPTCTQPGHTEGSFCERCKEVFIESTSLNALGHDVKTIERLEPTCTQPGHTEGSFCERCKVVFTESTSLNALGHDVKTIERLEPTCTQPGHTEGSFCERCKVVLTESTAIEPTGHSIAVIPAVEPTCTRPGLTAGEQCAVCNAILTEPQPVPAKGHDYRAETIAPTCTKGGYTKHTCAACGDSYADQRTARLGHFYGLWLGSGDSAHTASCTRKGCGHSAAMECSVFEYALPDGVQIAFCPVCGFRDNAEAMAAVENAKLIQGELSKGEIVVRETLLSTDDKLFTIAFEYAGKPVQPGERMEISLPIALAEGEVLTLLNPDGTEATIECIFEENATRVILEYPKADDAQNNLVRVLRLTKNNAIAD